MENATELNRDFLAFLRLLITKLCEEPYEELDYDDENDNGQVKQLDDLEFIQAMIHNQIEMSSEEVEQGIINSLFPYRVLRDIVLPEAFLSGVCTDNIMNGLIRGCEKISPVGFKDLNKILEENLPYLLSATIRFLTTENAENPNKWHPNVF